MDQWIFCRKSGHEDWYHSVRTVEKLLTEIQDSIPVIPLQEEMVKNVFPKISVDVNVGDWQEVIEDYFLLKHLNSVSLSLYLRSHFILFVSNI